MSKRLRSCAAGGLLLSLALGPGAIRAQDYPSGPMRIVVPFQAGGSTDMVARTLAQKLKDRFNQAVVGGEPRRRERHDRRGAGREIASGRAHHAARPIGLRVEPDPDEKPALRSARDLAAGFQPRLGPMVLVVHPSPSGEIGQGADRIRQVASGRAQLRLARQRLAFGPLRGVVRRHGGRQDDPRPLTRGQAAPSPTFSPRASRCTT